jgi:hypothetical protein
LQRGYLRGAGWYERGIFESSNALVLVRAIHRRDAGRADKDKEKKPQRRKGGKVVSVIKNTSVPLQAGIHMKIKKSCSWFPPARG